MIQSPLGAIDYHEHGNGPTLVFVPGSCSTGAAWRPVIGALGEGFRCITTSLPGYGGTAERRTASDLAMARVAEAIEAVVSRASAPVHLVGHSFGGLVATVVALRKTVPLASLIVLEAPAVMVLEAKPEEAEHCRDFRAMADAYFAAFAAGEPEAVARMIDFYGGDGTYASWPERVKAYARDTTAVNIRDWQSAFAFPMPPETLATVDAPSLVAWGGSSRPAVRRANELLAAWLGANRRSAPIPGATHFMIATHPSEVATLISEHVAASARC